MKNGVLIVLALGLGLFILIAMGTKQAPELEKPIYQEQPSQQPEIKPEKKPERPRPQPTTPESYEQALKIARTTQKQIFLFFEADWCSWCQKMKTDTLSKAEVKKALAGYVVYHVDTDRESELANKYGVSGIPVSAIITDTEKVVKKKPGYMGPRPFLYWLKR